MKKSILIYDDDPDILAVCKIILIQHNYRVETMTLNSDIINDINRVRPDVILMDLRIPGLGGEVAIDLVKNSKAARHVPIVLFSANSEIDEVFKRTKADAYLKKPFEINTMLNVIKATIAEKVEF